MSDIDIRGGGIVAVDTASLDAAARVLDDLRSEITRVSDSLQAASERMETASATFGNGLVMRTWFLGGEAGGLSERPQQLAAGLREMAALYEVVELRAQRGVAEAAGDAEALARIDARIHAIDAEHPWTTLKANLALTWRDMTWQNEFIGQLVAGSAPLGVWGAAGLGLAAWGLTASFRAANAGRVAPDSRLAGPAEPVRLVPITPAARGGTAPPTLALAAARIPSGDARIRVERYTMADGTRQFAVYVAGTRDPSVGGPDPFDMTSNVSLYTGARGASYEAVLAALADAGAERGDVVHAFAHSQGAMVAAHVAVEGGFDTRTLVGFGSPVEAAVGPGTLSVSVRHTDDPVGVLAAGGNVAPVGAPGSFIAERTYDPLPGAQDATMVAHHLDGYVKTAALLDGSEDPRMDAVRDTLAELGAAASVDVTEYDVVRVSPSAGGGE